MIKRPFGHNPFVVYSTFGFTVLVIVGLAMYIFAPTKMSQLQPTAGLALPDQRPTSTVTTTTKPVVTTATIAEPITHARNRVIKKSFGIKISPATSPVQPERFSGYHTGVDFETTADEQNSDVSISAICTGPLVVKKYATGYGGVAVQQCRIDDQPVTVIYGHLKLSSITAALNQSITQGERLGILGKGYSTETDGERKHLHVGIHKGTTITVRGYVATAKELAGWIDAVPLLP